MGEDRDLPNITIRGNGPAPKWVLFAGLGLLGYYLWKGMASEKALKEKDSN